MVVLYGISDCDQIPARIVKLEVTQIIFSMGVWWMHSLSKHRLCSFIRIEQKKVADAFFAKGAHSPRNPPIIELVKHVGHPNQSNINIAKLCGFVEIRTFLSKHFTQLSYPKV